MCNCFLLGGGRNGWMDGWMDIPRDVFRNNKLNRLYEIMCIYSADKRLHVELCNQSKKKK